MIRRAAVSGYYYPAHREELQATVDDLLSEALEKLPPSTAPSRLWVVPHAGYAYSGAIAARTYAQIHRQIAQLQNTNAATTNSSGTPAAAFARVAIVCPAHRIDIRSIALPESSHFETPLGMVQVDTHAVDELFRLKGVEWNEGAHRLEHGVEVQLPFLQTILPNAMIIPVTVGDVSVEQVEEVLECLWRMPDCLILISTDLSHHLSEMEARRRDDATVNAIVELRDDVRSHDQACGYLAIEAAVRLARREDLVPHVLQVGTSADHLGDRKQVVGYGALAFYAARELAQMVLVEIATQAILRSVEGEDNLLNSGTPSATTNTDAPASILDSLPDIEPVRQLRQWLKAQGACFVTLRRNGQLRACIGSVRPWQSLQSDIADNARGAALHDPRQGPLQPYELQGLQIEISVISSLRPLHFTSEQDLHDRIRPNHHGVLLQCPEGKGLFLPQVWDALPSADDFLRELRRKAGLPANYPLQRCSLQVFTVESFSSPRYAAVAEVANRP